MLPECLSVFSLAYANGTCCKQANWRPQQAKHWLAVTSDSRQDAVTGSPCACHITHQAFPSCTFIFPISCCSRVTGSRELLALSLVIFVSKHFFVCFLAADPAVKNASTQHTRDAENQMTSLQIQSSVDASDMQVW